jgi:hypothetical protein
MTQQESPRWGAVQNIARFVDEGYPFNEGFPVGHVLDGNLYSLKLRDGSLVSARVNYSRQYRAEGLTWEQENGEPVSRSIVMGWKQQE